MRKHVLLLVLIMAVICLALSGCVNVDRQLEKAVAEVNATQYPAQIDEETILDSLSCAPGRNLTYHYTLLTFTKENLKPETLKAMEIGLRINLIKVIRSGVKVTKQFRKAGVIFHHEYRDRDGNMVVNIVLTPKDYNFKE